MSLLSVKRKDENHKLFAESTPMSPEGQLELDWLGPKPDISVFDFIELERFVASKYVCKKCFWFWRGLKDQRTLQCGCGNKSFLVESDY
jgi:hypothetical protein